MFKEPVLTVLYKTAINDYFNHELLIIFLINLFNVWFAKCKKKWESDDIKCFVRPTIQTLKLCS